jgi:peptidyl-prolyl cis-trans isomerase D
MLSFFRRGFWAKIMLGVLGLALFAIVITGFGTGGLGGLGGLGSLGGSGGALARIDGEKIDAAEVREQVDRQLSRARQQRPELDLATFLSSGALEEIVSQLIASASLRLFGEEQGLAAGKAMVDREIASNPAFRSLAGQFDEATFRRALQTEKITEAQLRKDIAAAMVQRQLLLPVAGSPHVPSNLAFRYASLLLERRSGVVGAVPAAAMGVGREPSEAEVAAFYRSSQARYTVPERRVLRYAAIGPEQVAAQAQATEAEIAAAYRANEAGYAARETRTLSQVIFPLPEEAAARAFAAKVGQGTSFAQAASQAHYSPADTALGEQTKEGFARTSSPAVANAAFAAAKGAVTAPVRSELGWHVVKVEDVKRIAARPLAAVRGEIAARIAAEKVQNAMADLAGRIETAISDGSTFDEIARTEKLAIRETAPITATGAAPDTPGWKTPAEVTPLLEGAFAMEPDEDPVVETIVPNERFALLTLGRVIPAAPPPLSQIKERVKADLIARRASDRARAVAASIVSRINAGTAPAEAFAQADVPLPGLQPISASRREVAAQNRQVPPPLAMLFSIPRGKARLLAAPNGSGWFVVYLRDIVPGDAGKEPQLVGALRGQFREILGDEYAQQFSRAAQSGMKIERNAAAIAKLKGELLGGGGAQ